MMDELDRYYRKKGIAAMKFECSHRGKCHSGNGQFVEAKEAFVGSEYVKGTLPRVLFISLDAASVSETPSDRTWSYIRHYEENIFDHNHKRNRHWKETHLFALEILKKVAEKYHIKLTEHDVCRYFAHTNSAKCKDMSKGHREGSPILFRNCMEYLPGEVEILQPDIIVTQGNAAYDSIKKSFDPRIIRKSEDMRYEELEIEQHKVLKFKTYHPSARGGVYNQQMRDVFPWFYSEANHFFKSWRPGT